MRSVKIVSSGDSRVLTIFSNSSWYLHDDCTLEQNNLQSLKTLQGFGQENDLLLVTDAIVLGGSFRFGS